MKKKILSLMLALVLTLAIAPAAFADGSDINDAEFRALYSITNVTSESTAIFWEQEVPVIHTTAPTSITASGEIIKHTLSVGIYNASLINGEVVIDDYDDFEQKVYAEDMDTISDDFTFVLETGTYAVIGQGDVTFVVVVGGDSAHSTPAPAVLAPAAKTVNPTASSVYVNGVAKAFEAYTIDGNNYFKLHDLALVLNGSSKQFEAGYNDDTKAITLTSSKPYTVAGGELTKGDGKAKTATPTASKIYLDGKELNVTMYTIGGNNFFKLRDLMQALDVYVGYDNATKNITVDTSRGYIEE